MERIVSTDDKQKLPPPPTVSAEAIEEARAAASSTWAIPKEAAKPAPGVFRPPSAGEPEKDAGSDEPEKKAPEDEPEEEAGSVSEKKAAPVIVANASTGESAGIPTPITRATEVFDALLADVSAPIPVGVQTRRKAASAEAAGTRQRIVATPPRETSPTSQPHAHAPTQERAPDRQRWLFAAGGLVLGVVIGLAMGRSPDPPERPSVARSAPERAPEAPPKLRVAATAKSEPESESPAPLPPAVSYPDRQENEPAAEPEPAPEPDQAREPTAKPEPDEPEAEPSAPAAAPGALGSVTANGTFIDELVVGEGDERGSCTSPRTSFSIATDERVYACFHIMRPRDGDRLTVRWRKDGDTKRRSFFPMTKTVEATRTRAFMKIKEGYEGTWSVHVAGPDGAELASKKFTIVP